MDCSEFEVGFLDSGEGRWWRDSGDDAAHRNPAETLEGGPAIARTSQPREKSVSINLEFCGFMPSMRQFARISDRKWPI